MVYAFGLLFVFILVFYLARLLFYAVRPGQATRPTMESTADMVFARVGPAFAESPSDSQRQSSDMEYAHNPQYTTNQLRTLGRSVTRSHPDAASDPDLPCYTEEPTSSQVLLVDPRVPRVPAAAHLGDNTIEHSVSRTSVTSASTSTSSEFSTGPLTPLDVAPPTYTYEPRSRKLSFPSIFRPTSNQYVSPV